MGLFLQAALFGHGGFTTLGINSCIMVVPALLAGVLFSVLQRVPWVREPWFRGGMVFVSVLGWSLSLVFSGVLLGTNWPTGLAALDAERAIRLTTHPITLVAVTVVASLATWAERRLENAPEFPLGLLIGELAVLATLLFNCVVLIGGGQEDWHTLVLAVLVAHLPIAVVEGIITGFTVGFLVRVKPEMIGLTAAPEETACSVDPLP
jgi:ABC-type Co2+ transport system permease subunit